MSPPKLPSPTQAVEPASAAPSATAGGAQLPGGPSQTGAPVAAATGRNSTGGMNPSPALPPAAAPPVGAAPAAPVSFSSATPAAPVATAPAQPAAAPIATSSAPTVAVSGAPHSPPLNGNRSDGSALSAQHATAVTSAGAPASSESLSSSIAATGGGGGSRHRYGKRASDSSGGAAAGSLLSSPPPPKGTSTSGATHQQQQQQAHSAGASGFGPGLGLGLHGFAGRGRLQQLGQRLNFVGLGRKKQTTFAPGTSGGSGALSGPEDSGGGGGGGGGVSSGTLGNSSVHLPQHNASAPASTAGGGLLPSPSGGFYQTGASMGGVATGGAFGSVTGSMAGGGSVTTGGGVAGGGGAATTTRIDTHLSAASSKAAAVEEFNPPNHPVNPFSYLATPFRVMAKTKAGVAMGRYATTALRLKRDGVPPASYMWLWLGNFKRWHRRYFVASEAPGVLLIYKRANMKGKVWSTSLCDATVVQDDSHPRQIRLVTPSGTIFLRVLRPEERQPWIHCLRESVATYRRHKEVVDTFTAATAAAAEGGEATVQVSALPSLSSPAVDQDMEQRRRIRAYINERMAELGPLVTEVERHLGVVGNFLAGAASGFGHLNGPLLSHSSSISHGLSTRARGTLATPSLTFMAAEPAAAAAASTAAAASASSSPLAPAAHAAAAEVAAANAAAAAAVAAGGPESSPGSARHSASRAAAAAAAGLGIGIEQDVSNDRGPSRLRTRSRGAPTIHSPTLAASVSALVEGLRLVLYKDALRITTLEAENAVLNKTVKILRANTHRNAARSRGVSTPGLNALTAAGASVSRGSGGAAGGSAGGGAGAAGAAAALGSGVGHDDAASEGSACTADEDAFDVVEAFDDGVDYSILDDDAPHLHHRLGCDDDEAPYVQHGNYPEAADEEEETDEDAEEDAAELAQQAEVLNALEVVRQVEYITANDKNTHLKTLLTADTPPPPDAEEEEGGKGKGKSRGKGEDTDATLDDEDDDDSEAAISTGGALGEGGAGSSGRRPYEGRSSLPAPKPLGRGFSIWSILKNMIGRDLTKITMPATINEPLSMTQRMCEVLEYRSLLEKACATPDSVDRLMLVSCWLLAGYNSQPLRDNKPFNPLLGETFEWQAADGSARYLCEQVSHHPPVSCFVAEGGGPQGYDLYGEVETRTKFWGKTIDCILAGHMSLRIKAFGDEFRFNLGNLVISDIILGRYWVDLSLDLKLRNNTTGDTARLLVKPCRGYPYLKERGKILDAVVCDSEGREVWRITGSSMSSLYASLTPEAAAARGDGATTEPQLIWEKEPELPNPHEQYFMTRFALGLNDPADPIVPHLPPTDARFRPDMRALELGEWNRATSEKLRLEEKQRTARRLRKEAGEEYNPRWFKQALFNTKEMIQPASQPGSVWEYLGDYWDVRARKDWGELPDLF